MSLQVFPSWSKRFSAGPRTPAPLQQMYSTAWLRDLGQDNSLDVAGNDRNDFRQNVTGWTDPNRDFKNSLLPPTPTVVEPIIVEDEQEPAIAEPVNRLENGPPRTPYEPPRPGLRPTGEVVRGIVTSDVAGATVVASLPDEGNSVTANLMLPTGKEWNDVVPKYLADDEILLMKTPDNVWYAPGPFISESQLGSVRRATTTAAWTTGTTTTADLIGGDEESITVNFLEAYHADNFPVVGETETIAVFQGLDGKWYCPIKFIRAATLSAISALTYTGTPKTLAKTATTGIKVLGGGTAGDATTLFTATSGSILTGLTWISADRKFEYTYTTAEMIAKAAEAEGSTSTLGGLVSVITGAEWDGDNHQLSFARTQLMVLDNNVSSPEPITVGLGETQTVVTGAEWDAGTQKFDLHTTDLWVLESVEPGDDVEVTIGALIDVFVNAAWVTDGGAHELQFTREKILVLNADAGTPDPETIDVELGSTMTVVTSVDDLDGDRKIEYTTSVDILVLGTGTADTPALSAAIGDSIDLVTDGSVSGGNLVLTTTTSYVLATDGAGAPVTITGTDPCA